VNPFNDQATGPALLVRKDGAPFEENRKLRGGRKQAALDGADRPGAGAAPAEKRRPGRRGRRKTWRRGGRHQSEQRPALGRV